MKILAVAILLSVASLLLQACPPPAPPLPPTPDADAAPQDVPEASPVEETTPSPRPNVDPACAYACLTWKHLGCAEGADGNCGATLTKLSAHQLRPNPANGNKPLTCDDIGRAKTVDQVHAMGLPCHP
jgi:hypothetical protein